MGGIAKQQYGTGWIDIMLAAKAVRITGPQNFIAALKQLENIHLAEPAEEQAVVSHVEVAIHHSAGFKTAGTRRSRWYSYTPNFGDGLHTQIEAFVPPASMFLLARCVSGDAKTPIEQLAHIILYEAILLPVVKAADVDGIFLVHAAAFEIDGSAYIAAGESEVGKTRTVIELLARFGTRMHVYGDDLILTDGQRVLAIPKSIGLRGYHSHSFKERSPFHAVHGFVHRRILSRLSKHGLGHYRRSVTVMELGGVPRGAAPIKSIFWVSKGHSPIDDSQAAISMRSIIQNELDTSLAGDLWGLRSKGHASWQDSYLNRYADRFLRLVEQSSIHYMTLTEGDNPVVDYLENAHVN